MEDVECEKLINEMCTGKSVRQHEMGKILKSLWDRVKKLEEK